MFPRWRLQREPLMALKTTCEKCANFCRISWILSSLARFMLEARRRCHAILWAKLCFFSFKASHVSFSNLITVASVIIQYETIAVFPLSTIQPSSHHHPFRVSLCSVVLNDLYMWKDIRKYFPLLCLLTCSRNSSSRQGSPFFLRWMEQTVAWCFAEAKICFHPESGNRQKCAYF